MRTLFSLLLIISFALSSLPIVHAQDAPEQVLEIAEPASEVIPESAIEASTQAEPEIEESVIEEPTEAFVETEAEITVEEPELQVTEELIVVEELLPQAAEELQVVEVPASASLLIRYGENVAWSGDVVLTEGGTVSVKPTGESTAVDIASDSLLAALLSVDEQSDAFSVADLDYFPSFGSFLVNCIDAVNFSNACGEWQYVIDGVYPFVGIDDYVLEDGDEVFIYFGSPRRVLLTDSDIVVEETFTATAQSYDPETNAYSPLPGYTIGITQPDPNNPWSPIEIATSTSGTDGTGTFSLSSEGTFGIGLKEDFYFPSVSFTVSSTTDSDSGSGAEPTSFDFSGAYTFLVQGQESDGSWNTPIVTDWTAIALGISGSPSSVRSSLASYLRGEDVDLDTALDYERHAMALMALGIDPYTGGPRDYIEPIVEKFDGTQMDEENLVNDDAFAIITLMNAGYTKNDEIIQNMASFIVSKQKGDGSWTGGVDVSGAYIQALKLVSSLPGVSSAISKAEAYMRSMQNQDGGFGTPSDTFATSWALQGIEALGDTADNWKKDKNTPLSYLIDHQDEDGGMNIGKDSYDDRAWATAYAIPAAKGLTWAEILKNFKKPEGASAGKDESRDEDTATSTEDILAVQTEEPLVEAYAATTTVMHTADSVPEVSRSVKAEEVASAESPIDTENPSPQLAAAALESGVWESVKHFLSSFWKLLKSLVS